MLCCLGVFWLLSLGRRTFLLNTPTHLDSGSRVSPVSGHGQLQGAAVFKALVQGRLEVYPDGVRVVFLGLGLVAAHHLGATDRTDGVRVGP